MQFEQDAGSGFAYEMMDTMVSATEIFNTVLLNNLKKYFGIRNAFITVFDFKGNFLSLTDLNKIYIGEEHPYAQIADRDVCAKKIIDECRREGLWHDNLKPYIYRSSDLLARNDTQVSDYVHFLRDIMHADYMVIMPFDIDGCIHLCIYRGEAEGDYSDRELQNFEKIYAYIARTFKSFKALEKPKIVSNIKDEVILSKEDAYLITDINHRILACNKQALSCLSAMTGKSIRNDNLEEESALIQFVLQGAPDDDVKTTTINGYVFQVHPFPMSYIHGMVEMYHWITIHKEAEFKMHQPAVDASVLTKREKKVAELLCEGLSYQEIADAMFISFHTVKNHVQNIFSKYHVSNRYQFYQIYSNRH